MDVCRHVNAVRHYDGGHVFLSSRMSQTPGMTFTWSKVSPGTAVMFGFFRQYPTDVCAHVNAQNDTMTALSLLPSSHGIVLPCVFPGESLLR